MFSKFQWRMPLFLAIFALFSACGGRSQQALGGESNWLQRCTVDADCNTGSCLCSLCTTSCDRDGDCAERGGGECVAPSNLDARNCPGVVPEGNVCLRASTLQTGSDPSDAEAPSGDEALASSNATLESVETSGTASTVESLGSSEAASFAIPGSTDVPSGTEIVDAGSPSTAFESQCSFELLGYGMNCQPRGIEAGIVETPATSATDCMQICEQTPDCAGISESFWLGDDYYAGCYLWDTCDAPTNAGQEDGPLQSRGFKLRCDAPPSTATVKTLPEWQAQLPALGLRVSEDSACTFSVIERSSVCEDFGLPEFEPFRGATFEECIEACDVMPECTAVIDWWSGGPTEYACVLYTSTCERPYTSLDELWTHVKHCP